MKTIPKIIMAAFFTVAAFSATAQGTSQLLVPGKMWSSVEWMPWGGWYYKTYYNRFDGDTTINGVAYKKIWQAEDQNHSNWYLFGFIREDSTGSVFARTLSGNEGLIYNFNLEVNDSVFIHNPFYGLEFTTHVSQIDTIVIQPGGMSRKRITLAPLYTGAENEYWIEGIGSVAGILWSGLHTFLLTGSNNDLSCHWQNNNLVFNTNIFTNCWVTTVSVDEQEEGEVLAIYPLPATSGSVIHFEGLPGNNYHFELWNMFGQKIQTQPISSGDKLVLAPFRLKAGVYIMVLLSDNQVVKSLKFNVL
jgi:hypothetical protein